MNHEADILAILGKNLNNLLLRLTDREMQFYRSWYAGGNRDQPLMILNKDLNSEIPDRVTISSEIMEAVQLIDFAKKVFKDAGKTQALRTVINFIRDELE